ncbi:trigger factor [Phycisphaerales bacterium AB-hyl4]|uniref:Trigger factor n=1 Tax=Natronomicrosphaera hydrolytica TaxID=3242702 RepID=A0ABV4U3D6_9BACT
MADQDPKNDPTTTEATEATEERPEQSVTVENIGPARKKLVIEVPETRIKEKIESAYGDLGDEAVLPGFRRGRAPRRLIERRFGDSIRDDVKGQLLSESYTQALEDEKIDVLGEPEIKDIEELKLPESGPFKFEVEVEITPEVKLPALDKLEVKKRSAEVTDEDIDKEINRFRERFGDMKPIEGGEVQSDDFLACEVKVLAGENAGDDAEVIEHQAEAYVLVAGESREFKGHVAGIVVDDLGKRLAGKKVGDTDEISMTGPKGHENEKIKDQPITIKLVINRIERVEPAPVEKLVEQMGVESEDDMKTRIREMLEGRRKQQQTDDMHKQVVDQLVEQVEMELPEDLTSRQTERVLSRRRMELLYQGKSEQEADQEIAEQRSGSEDEAKRQLKQFFIIDKAAKDLEIEVAENEVNGRVAMMAMQQGRRPEKLRQDMVQRGELEQIYMQIREQKTLDKVIEQAKVVESDEKVESA